MAIEKIMEEAPTGVTVAERAVQAVSPISGVSPELFKTLNQRHSVEFIKEQQAKYKTQEEFLADAEKEAEHIRFTLAKQEANATQTLSSKPLSEGQEVNGKVVDKNVLENAQLWDTQRQEAAAKLLGRDLSDQQKQELIEAHWESAGEKGQDKEHLAGVYNLTRGQISREARKLSSFTPEERRKLFEAGLVGFLTPREWVTFDATRFTPGTAVRQIAEQALAMGIRGEANQRNLDRLIKRVESLLDDGKITDPTEVTLAELLVADLQDFQNKAELTPEPEPTLPPSYFEQVQNNILRLQTIQASSLLTVAEQTELDHARNERETLLLEVNSLGLLDDLKEQAYQLYRKTRIDVPASKKDDMREMLVGQLQNTQLHLLENRQYWASLERRGINQDRLGGIIDYVRVNNIALIRTVFENPRMDPTSTFQYQDNGVPVIWRGFTPRDESGRVYPAVTGGFDDIRKFVEKERRERPRFVGTYGNYLFYLEFIADGVEELPEAVDDFALRLEKEIVAGTIDTIQNNLQERLGWAEKAMQAFMRHFNLDRSDPTVMWCSSKMNSIGEIIRATVMADAGKEGSKNYIQAMDSWGRGFKTKDETGKKIGDNFFDVLYFEQDKNGWLPTALDQLTRNNGEYWRYGSNKVPFPNSDEREEYQQKRDQEIIELMATRELRSIDDLLTTHPVFIAFKTTLDATDPTLWPEYVNEAKAWERFVTGIDREDQRRPDARIKFEHPLARNLTRSQFNDMFRPLQYRAGETTAEYNKRIQDRRDKAKWILKRAERLATALMVDTEATSARIYLKDVSGKRTGEVKAFSVLLAEEVMKIVKKDELKPLKDRKFKAFHVLKKLGLVDFPLYNALDVGADDTGRNDLIKHFEAEPELKAIIDAKTYGPNAKTSIVRWMEDERRIITLVARGIRRAKAIPTKDSGGNDVFADGTDYENFPGEHTPGGGIKYLKNDVLYPYYGISRDTVRVNGLITAADYGVRTLLGEYGCQDEDGPSFLKFVAWQKRRDELELKKEGPAFRNPAGVTKWVSRVGGGLEQASLWTNPGDSEHPEGLLWSPLKGPYRVRGLHFNQNNYTTSDVDPIKDPFGALNLLTEPAYTEYLTTIGDVFSKIEGVMKARRKIENIYGMAAGTAAFMNTLILYDVLDWMQYYPEEFRGKFGYAIDVSQALSRYLANTALFEDGTIFSSDDWKIIMKGGGKVKMLGGGDGPMEIPAGEGLIDVLPKYLTNPITVGEGKYTTDPIPVGGNRIYPTVLDLREEKKDYKEKYNQAKLNTGGKVLL